MTTFALSLVMVSALAHATWNLFAKRAGGGVPFLWLALALAIPLYAPIAIAVLIVSGTAIAPTAMTWMFVNAALNVAYFVFLQRGYRHGDLSLVYPLARGSGPVLATLGAILLFGERPSGLAIAGAISIALGVIALTGDPRTLRARGAGRAVGYALITGVTIAAYTLWDKRGVTGLLIPPILYEWGSNIWRVLILAPFVLPRAVALREQWTRNRTPVFVVAILSPLAYMLVLTALSLSPVSYVAPAREIGILLGVILGARSLSESEPRRRSLAAVLLVGGVVALALG